MIKILVSEVGVALPSESHSLRSITGMTSSRKFITPLTNDDVCGSCVISWSLSIERTPLTFMPYFCSFNLKTIAFIIRSISLPHELIFFYTFYKVYLVEYWQN